MSLSVFLYLAGIGIACIVLPTGVPPAAGSAESPRTE
jgi:hypothetical protein